MVIIAEQVAGRRETGVPRARTAATIGVGTSSLAVLATLFASTCCPPSRGS